MMILYNFNFKKIKLYNIRSIILFKDYKNYPPLGPGGWDHGCFYDSYDPEHEQKKQKIFEN